MQRQGVSPDALQPILERLSLPSMGSVEEYAQIARDLGWEQLGWHDWTPQMVRHYSRVLEELERREQELAPRCSEDYRGRMKQGLRRWIDAGAGGALAWGVLHFRKPPATAVTSPVYRSILEYI